MNKIFLTEKNFEKKKNAKNYYINLLCLKKINNNMIYL